VAGIEVISSSDSQGVLMSDSIVGYSLEDSVSVLRLDDGKANAFSHAALDAVLAALDQAEKDQSKSLALIGRPGRFSAGFDLSVMSKGYGEVVALVSKGAEMAIRLFEWHAPVVLGVTGHALAMGAVTLLTADERIGAEGSFKIGLNEVAIGMALPEFALIFAEERISRRHLHRATVLAEIYGPDGAVDAGYLDRVLPAEEVEAGAIARARELGEGLDAKAYRRTKLALRGPALERLRQTSQPKPTR
jgi:enoyl-CoA hydratase